MTMLAALIYRRSNFL